MLATHSVVNTEKALLIIIILSSGLVMLKYVGQIPSNHSSQVEMTTRCISELTSILMHI